MADTEQCAHHDGESSHLLRLVFASILTFIALVLVVIFLIWAILQPAKPRFTLQDATVFAFNLSYTGAAPSPTAPTPNTLTLSMQATLAAVNPNSRIGIYYQNLHAYASYMGQQISLAAELPPTYQDHRDVTVWSPYLNGPAAPVSPSVLESLRLDQSAGVVLVNVKVNGGVKWKVGTWVSGNYHISVNCPAYIRLGGGPDDDGIGVATPAAAVKYQFLQSCVVDF